MKLVIVIAVATVVAAIGICLTSLAQTPDVAKAGAFLALLGLVVLLICGLVWLFP